MLSSIADKMMFPGVGSKAGSGERQSLLFFEYPESDKVLLYSHGNCASVSLIVGWLKKLSWSLQVNVCCYEYPGYLDGGGSSESQVNEAALNALEWLIYAKDYTPRHIILMGRSIGSGPTLWLASRAPKMKFAGIILQSPFTSIRDLAEAILRPYMGCFFFEGLLHPWIIGYKYDNVASISQLDPDVPILFVHGTQDKIIPVEMTSKLMALSHHHDDHKVHIQNNSTHNKFDEATLILHMMQFIERLDEREKN